MRLVCFIFIITLPTLANAEKVSFSQANLHLNIPANFERVSEGIAPETLIRVRVKGRAPTPQCSVSFAKDPELNALTMRQIETVIDQMTGEMFVSMMGKSSPMFRTAKVLSTTTTYWSGYKSLRVKLSVDLQYMGFQELSGRGFYDLFFTANRKGIYGINCGHTNNRKASLAIDELRKNILIGGF
jgi:hypothetical protein